MFKFNDLDNQKIIHNQKVSKTHLISRLHIVSMNYYSIGSCKSDISNIFFAKRLLVFILVYCNIAFITITNNLSVQYYMLNNKSKRQNKIYYILQLWVILDVQIKTLESRVKYYFIERHSRNKTKVLLLTLPILLFENPISNFLNQFKKDNLMFFFAYN